VRRNDADWLRLPPSRRPGRWLEILEALAWLNSMPLDSLDRYIRIELSALPLGATVIAISAAVTGDLVMVLLDAKRAGHPVSLIAIGDAAPANVPPDLPMFWIGGQTAYRDLNRIEITA
jgi:hypothetical protein